jgi:hypothetical protein
MASGCCSGPNKGSATSCSSFASCHTSRRSAAPSVSRAALFRANCPDADEVVVIGDAYDACDLQLPLLSIPYVLQLRDQVAAPRTPYLRATGDVRSSLDHLIPSQPSVDDRPLRVGVCWAGQPKHLNDRNRSLTLEILRPLLDVAGVEWYAVQKGESAEMQIAPFNANSALRGQPTITPLGPALSSFVDTSHAVARFDVVLTVDTSVAHLAGAMGVPVWVLVPFVPDWRWQISRGDSPWYPSARLFRQPSGGDWPSVVTHVATALRDVVAASMRTSSQAA